MDEITHVINFDPPRTAEDYVHRIGRTGRAGRTGTGVTLVLPEQELEVRRDRRQARACRNVRGVRRLHSRLGSQQRRPAAALPQPAARSLMAKKRSPQTAAKRAREQAMREKRERKQAKKQARLDGTAPPPPDEPAESDQQ